MILRNVGVSIGLALTALGCGDSEGPTPVDAGVIDAVSVDADPTQGRLTIAGSVGGATNKIVLAGIPGGGGGFQASICVQLTTDPATFSAVARAPSSSNPCDLGADVILPNGTYDVTAGIYTPGEQVPEQCADTQVTINSDTTVTLPAFGACN